MPPVIPPIKPLSEVRKGHIREVLAHAKGDVALACRILGIAVEELPKLLAAHGLEALTPTAPPPLTPEQGVNP